MVALYLLPFLYQQVYECQVILLKCHLKEVVVGWIWLIYFCRESRFKSVHSLAPLLHNHHMCHPRVRSNTHADSVRFPKFLSDALSKISTPSQLLVLRNQP